MIIPMRCFTCGNVISDKWTPFVKLIMDKKNSSNQNIESSLDIDYINITEDGSPQKTIEGEALDELELHKYCCRRMFLTNVHLITQV